jgi:hypothetical protein
MNKPVWTVEVVRVSPNLHHGGDGCGQVPPVHPPILVIHHVPHCNASTSNSRLNLKTDDHTLVSKRLTAESRQVLQGAVLPQLELEG